MIYDLGFNYLGGVVNDERRKIPLVEEKGTFSSTMTTSYPTPDLGSGWKSPTSFKTKPITRYAPFASTSSSSSSDLPQMSEEAFLDHLHSGAPFIVNIPPKESNTTLSFDSVPSFLSHFSESWPGEDPLMWFGRVKDMIYDRFQYWLYEGNKVTLDNFLSVASEFPQTYLSLAANDPGEIDMVKRVFPHPSFIPPSVASVFSGMWMYAGLEGAGVNEHIDTVGCVCSWAHLLIGKKHWWFRTPPGVHPREKFDVLQEENDFIFWCVGYHHQTQIESAESLDVHGYVPLSFGKDSFANNFKGYMKRATREVAYGGHSHSALRQMGMVEQQCSWTSMDGIYARVSASSLLKGFCFSAVLLFLFVMFLFVRMLLRCCFGGRKEKMKKKKKSAKKD